MKKTSVLSFFTDWLLAALLCAGGIGCLCSGYSMNIPSGAVAVSMVLWPLAGVICARLRRGLQIALGLGAGCLLLLGNLDLLQHGKNLFLLLGRILYLGYGWDIGGIFQEAGKNILQSPVGYAVLALTMLLGLAAGMVIGRRKSALWCLPIPLLPLLLTLMVVDTVPSLLCIFVNFLGISLLLLTHSTRQQDPRQGAVLVLCLLLPLTLCTGYLLECIPQAEYQAPDMHSGWLAFLYGRADDLPFIDVDGEGNVSVNISGTSGDQVNLTWLGPKTQSARLVMTLDTNYSGALYLRGKSYSDYTGTSWTNYNSPDTEPFQIPKWFQQGNGKGDVLIGYGSITRVRIRTTRTRDVLYVPYYPDDQSLVLREGELENENQDMDYSFYINSLADDWQATWIRNYGDLYKKDQENMYSGKDAFLALPESTGQWAREYLQENLQGLENMYPFDAARRIADHVKNSAEYDLNTGRMAWNRNDFAQWFLDESDSGYCVHFASAATVLLRAAGIPARYVEGYAVRIPSDLPNTGVLGGLTGIGDWNVQVTESMAHAWVEYYMPNVGWVMLEPTPAGAVQTFDPATSTTAPTTTPSTSTGLPLPEPSTGSTSTAGTAPSTRPTQGTGSAAGQPVEERPDLTGLWLSLAGIAAGVFLVTAQWQLRLLWRHKRLHKGSRNRQALAKWRHVQYLAKLQKAPVPEALRALAQKAKFSNHALTGPELRQFDTGIARYIDTMKARGLFWQIWYRLILALY